MSIGEAFDFSIWLGALIASFVLLLSAPRLYEAKRRREDAANH